MSTRIRSGGRRPGGVAGYPLDRLYKEIAYLAYYFHWPLTEIVNLDHRQRARFVEEVTNVNRAVVGEKKEENVIFDLSHLVS